MTLYQIKMLLRDPEQAVEETSERKQREDWERMSPAVKAKMRAMADIGWPVYVGD
jgi:hypothetical protein